jgi:hypothetical protein
MWCRVGLSAEVGPTPLLWAEVQGGCERALSQSIRASNEIVIGADGPHRANASCAKLAASRPECGDIRDANRVLLAAARKAYSFMAYCMQARSPRRAVVWDETR